jgi:hypothetical protein
MRTDVTKKRRKRYEYRGSEENPRKKNDMRTEAPK